MDQKKKMTIELLDTNQTVVIRATIPTIRSSILVVRWSETSIWRQWYGGQQDQSGGICRSHYFGGPAIGPPPQAAPLGEPPVLVVYLIYKFKLKKYDHYGK